MDVKLRSLHDAARKRSSAELARHTRNLARLLASALKDGTWADPSARAKQDLLSAADAARVAAYYLDAASFIATKVFSPGYAKIVDIRLKYDLVEAQSQILEMFASAQAPRRGFVYVSWSRRPEEFYYVGKARAVERLNLSAHGKLANTVGRATTLSLIFPSRSTDETLSGVEASVMALIESHTGRLPELNARAEQVPDHEGTNELATLRQFLIDVAKSLQW